MDISTVVKKMVILRGGLKVLTDPKLIKATQEAGHEDLEARRRVTVRDATKAMQNLLFAYNMMTTKIVEPKRILTR